MITNPRFTHLGAGILLWCVATIAAFAQTAPVVNSHPSSFNINVGQSAEFYSSAYGSPDPVYHWQRLPAGSSTWGNLTETGSYSGTATNHLSIAFVTVAMSGDQFRCVVTNSAGSDTSYPAPLTVSPDIAPQVYRLPAAVTVNSGATVYMDPSIIGSQPISYQWTKNGIAIPFATSPTYYSSSAATTADNGQYALTATNSVGTATSSSVTVTVSPPIAPGIHNLPAAQVMNSGASISFSPSISGTQPMTYQWKKDGIAIASANSSYYSKYGVTPADSGVYTVDATNSVGTTTSSSVIVTVLGAIAPGLINMPAAVAVEYGIPLSLNPTFSDNQPRTYQWKKDGVAISNAVSSSYLINSSVTTADSGLYILTATNLSGATTDAAVTVTVNPAVTPEIFNLPYAVTVEYGNTLELMPSISGTQPITFQWKKDGLPIANATSSNYSVPNSTIAEVSGLYTLTATNLAGAVTSSPVIVTVNPAVAPGIFNLPAIARVTYGFPRGFGPVVTGTQPMTYQWKKNGVAILNATSGYYSIDNPTPAESGAYTVEVTNLVGTTVSSAIAVTVDAALPPKFTQQPVSLTMPVGLPATLLSFATGTGFIYYQWNLDGQPIVGATSSVLVIPNFQAGNTGNYTVVATNVDGSLTSNVAALGINSLGAVAVSGGEDHSLLIKSDGTLWAVGNNSSGQLGDGTDFVRRNPIQVSSSVVSVAAGGRHSLFIKSDGTLWAMGSNSYGQLGDGTTINRHSPVQIMSGVVSIAGGSAHSLILKDDGTLWATGNNENGQLGDGTNTMRHSPAQIATGVLAVSAGATHSLFIKSDGTLWAMGGNYYGQLGDGTNTSRNRPVQIAAGVHSIATGSVDSLFIKVDRALWATGNNSSGQLGDGTITQRKSPVQIATAVEFVAAGGSHSLFVKSDATLWSMGANYSGQLGDGTTLDRHSPVQIATGVKSVAAGYFHSLMAKADGSIWSAGYNSAGQLGDGNVPYDQSTPEQILTGTVSVPSAPSVSTASDGVITTGVRLTWSLTLGATQYEVWRATSNDPVSATLIASNVPSALYYDLTAVAGNTYYYWIKAGNVAGNSVYSVSDSGFVGIAPLITTQPTSQTVVSGNSVTFTVAASGTTAPTYQWKKGAVDIAGATTNTYTIASPILSDAGSYTVVATNSVSSVTSNAAVLTVHVPPTFTTQPLGGNAAIGTSVTFTALASGTPAPTYQWRKNGAAINGATGSAHTIASTALGDAGSYTVVAANIAGIATSDAAILTVGTPPAGFDVSGYLARYPAMAAVYGGNPYGAWLHYHDVGIYDGEVFDELFRVEEYLALYPDLFAIFGSDLGSALDHWLSTGRIEGKLGRIPLEFKAQGYFSRNPDVAAAVNNDPILAWGHYWLYGIYEGRAYDDELRVFEYLAINADLTAAFVNDWRQAALHWMRYGRTEGRLGRLPLTFNVTEYLVRSPDVAAVWGTNPTTVFLHYWAYGIDENRTYDDIFRPDEYLALNPDLAVALGTDRRAAFKHWVRYGQTEGRPSKFR